MAAPLDFPTAPVVGTPYVANGKSWVWDGVTWVAQNVAASGMLISTLHETIFAGMPVGPVLAGANVFNGVTWNVGYGTGGAGAIVAAGLQMTWASGSTENGFSSGAGEFARLVTQDRWTRGRVGLWTRTATYNRGSASSGFCYVNGLYAGAYPAYGLYNRRVLTGNGMQINGGMWFGSETGAQFYNTAANEPSDVTLLYFRSPFEVEHWYGTWAGGWPTVSAMRLGGCTRLNGAYYSGAGVQGMTATNLTQMLGSGGQAGNNSPSVTIERHRITTWD